jgi:hypothetical protein
MNSFLLYLAENLPEDKKWMLHQRIAMQPRAQIFKDLVEFEQAILKAVLNKHGEASAQYQFFNRIKNTIIQAGEQQFLIEQLQASNQSLHQLNEYLFKENARLYTALNRYETVEEMSLAGTVQTHIDRVQKLINETKLSETKKATATT